MVGTVPEPATMGLMALGEAGGLAAVGLGSSKSEACPPVAVNGSSKFQVLSFKACPPGLRAGSAGRDLPEFGGRLSIFRCFLAFRFSVPGSPFPLFTPSRMVVPRAFHRGCEINNVVSHSAEMRLTSKGPDQNRSKRV